MKSIRTKVVHSKSKTAWNVIGDVLGGKYKIARVPYNIHEGDQYEMIKTREKVVIEIVKVKGKLGLWEYNK